jgi:hypothetical protein
MTGILPVRAWPIHATFVLHEHVWCQVVRPGHDDMPIASMPNLCAPAAEIFMSANVTPRP